MEPITVVGPINYRTGYGIDTCRKALALLDLGYEVLVRATNYEESEHSPVPYAIQERLIYEPLKHGWEFLSCPPCFQPTLGRPTIYSSTLETSVPPPGAVAMFNQARQVVVPCEWNRESLTEAGVTVPISLCRQSTDPIFVPQPMPDRSYGATIFGCAGNAGPIGKDRKGIDEVEELFDRYVYGINCQLRVLKGYRTPTELLDWYAGIHVFLSGSHGEAWGRMVHEAMAVGRPVIGCDIGGQGRLITAKTGWPVRYVWRSATGGYVGLGDWASWNIDNMVGAITAAWMATDKQLARRGRAAARHAQALSDGEKEDLERILWDVGCRQPVVKKKRRWWPSETDLIVDFYRGKQAMPKLALRKAFKDYGLTNTPDGIGDLMLLSPFPSQGIEVHSRSLLFAELSILFPRKSPPDWKLVANRWVGADLLQKRYAMGNGHLIQRLHRVFGLDVPDRPTGKLQTAEWTKCGPEKNRVAIHLTPGRHAEWQRRYIHPRAREVYAASAKIIRLFIATHPEMTFAEVGTTRSGLIPEAANWTGHSLAATVDLLATCDYFLGIMSGPLHLATAVGCKCIVIINFPDPNLIFLPTLKDVPIVESEWMYPQHVHLHQDGGSKLVPKFSYSSLSAAFNGDIYPYWSEQWLPLIHEKI